MSKNWFFDSCPMSVVMLEWPSKMTNENPHIWIDVYIYATSDWTMNRFITYITFYHAFCGILFEKLKKENESSRDYYLFDFPPGK